MFDVELETAFRADDSPLTGDEMGDDHGLRNECALHAPQSQETASIIAMATDEKEVFVLG